MHVLIDNDALLKLARYGLLDAALTSLGVQRIDAQVLATARYALLPAKDRLKHCKDKASADELEEFLACVSRIHPEAADADMLDVLTRQSNIDAGEALLLAVAASDTETVVITGDKRALAALCAGETVAPVKGALEGRVISLEVLFAFLIANEFEKVQVQVRAKLDVDRALSNVFGVSTAASLESVREALWSYIDHLRRATGALLHHPPTSFGR
jgi:hypothetical protein